MTRRNVTSFAAALAMAALTTAVCAQGPLRGPGGQGGPMGSGEPGGPMLVMAPAVQKELKLTDSQKSELKKLDMSAAQKRRQTFSKNRHADFDPEKMRTLMESQRREQEEAVAKILDKKQKDRLTEIDLQREGMLAVARTDIATKLELTSDQSEKIKGIMDEMREAERKTIPGPQGELGGFRRPGTSGGGLPDPEAGVFGGGFPGGEGGFPGGGPPEGGAGGFPGGGFPDGGPPRGDRGFPGGGLAEGAPDVFEGSGGGPTDFNNDKPRARLEKIRKEMDKIRSDVAQQIAAVLLPDQKLKFDKMLGKPFDFTTIRSGPGGPRIAPRSTRSAPRSRSQIRQRSHLDTEQPQPQMEPVPPQSY